MRSSLENLAGAAHLEFSLIKVIILWISPLMQVTPLTSIVCNIGIKNAKKILALISIYAPPEHICLFIAPSICYNFSKENQFAEEAPKRSQESGTKDCNALVKYISYPK
jgi:hypothetical protein